MMGAVSDISITNLHLVFKRANVKYLANKKKSAMDTLNVLENCFTSLRNKYSGLSSGALCMKELTSVVSDCAMIGCPNLKPSLKCLLNGIQSIPSY